MEELLKELTIRATEDDIAKTFNIPDRLVRDYHFKWLFLAKFKTYDEIVEFVNEFEPNSPKNRAFSGFMKYFEENGLGKKYSYPFDKREWACGALSRIRRIHGGSYKFCCYAKG